MLLGKQEPMYIYSSDRVVFTGRQHQGRRPRQKSRRDNKMMCRTSMYAVVVVVVINGSYSAAPYSSPDRECMNIRRLKQE